MRYTSIIRDKNVIVADGESQSSRWKNWLKKIGRKICRKNSSKKNCQKKIVKKCHLVEKIGWKKLMKKVSQKNSSKEIVKKNRQKKSSKNVFEPCGTQASSGTRTSSLLTAKANHLHAQRKRLNYFFLSLFFCICRHMYHTLKLGQILHEVAN